MDACSSLWHPWCFSHRHHRESPFLYQETPFALDNSWSPFRPHLQDLCFSKCSPWASRTSRTQEHVRNTEPQPSPQPRESKSTFEISPWMPHMRVKGPRSAVPEGIFSAAGAGGTHSCLPFPHTCFLFYYSPFRKLSQSFSNCPHEMSGANCNS